MSKATKICLITASALVILGLAIFVSAMTLNGWNFDKLTTVKFETNTYVITESFSNISVNSDDADILFAQSDDQTCKVVCKENPKVRHSVSVKSETLLIDVSDERVWYDYINITTKNPEITICLPENVYSKLVIKEHTGDIFLPGYLKFDSIDISASTGDINCNACAYGNIKVNLSAGSIQIANTSSGTLELAVTTGKVTVDSADCKGNITIDVSTGEVNMTNIKCTDLTSRGSTGNIVLTGVTADEKIHLERSTGNISLNGCDAADIFLKTTTGNVTGRLLSDKIFTVESHTGKIEVPQTVTGGKCDITTDTGDVKIEIG